MAEVKIACVVRYVNSSTWAPIDDGDHTPIGLASVELLVDRVRVHYDFTAETVYAVAVTVDEAFASVAVRCGASVGLSYLDIFFYMGSSPTPVNPGLLSKAGANVWVLGYFEVTE